jgi:hypothetical protein
MLFAEDEINLSRDAKCRTRDHTYESAWALHVATRTPIQPGAAQDSRRIGCRGHVPRTGLRRSKLRAALDFPDNREPSHS